MPTPPPDIANDPARLAMWQQSHGPPDPTVWDSSNDIEEARGCDKWAFYKCHHYQRNATRVSCTHVWSVPGISHW